MITDIYIYVCIDIFWILWPLPRVLVYMSVLKILVMCTYIYVSTQTSCQVISTTHKYVYSHNFVICSHLYVCTHNFCHVNLYIRMYTKLLLFVLLNMYVVKFRVKYTHKYVCTKVLSCVLIFMYVLKILTRTFHISWSDMWQLA